MLDGKTAFLPNGAERFCRVGAGSLSGDVMSKQVTLCIVGCGSAATEHIRAVSELSGARITSVVSRNSGRAGSARRLARADRQSSSLKEALAGGGFDACILCTPNHTHYEMSKTILQAGRHLLLEKPMTLHLRQSRALVRMAESRGLTLMVAHTRRFMPAFVKARQLIRAGRLGRVLLVSDRWMEHRPVARNWKGRRIDMSRASRDSLIFHHGAHTVDVFRWMLGSEITKVSAASATGADAIVDDSDLAVLLRMTGGAVVSIVHSFSAAIGDRSTVITGEKGTLRIENDVRLTLGRRALVDGSFDDAYAAGVLGQDRAFLRAVRTGQEPPASGRDVCRTMEVLERIRRQAHE